MLLFLIMYSIGFLALSVIFTLKINKLDILKKINNKILSWFISIIPLALILIFMRFDVINTAIILLYTLIIWYMCDLCIYIFEKIYKHKISNMFSFIFGIIVSTIFLISSYKSATNVVGTYYELYTNRDIGMENFRIVQLSDTHIGSTMSGDKFSKYMEEINKLNPDIVVITGDYIDDDTTKKDMIKASEGLGKLKTKYGVYFVYGNHDKGYFDYRGYTTENLEAELKKNNVIILEDEVYNVTDNICLVGRKDQSEKRKSIYELVYNIDSEKYIIVLNHQPKDYENEKKAGVDLVLSGHTHGGQFYPLGQIGVLLGINDSFYGLKKINYTNFIVNSGLGDWTIKFRTGSIAEYGVIDIKKETL